MAVRGGGKRNADGDRGVIIRRIEIVESGGHHGGAWKVAYADFVTAMMAFFLLMWLLNATTEEQRRGLADYFSPVVAFSHSMAGSGQPFGGKTPYDEGALASDRGAVQLVTGKAPVVPDAEESDGDVQPQTAPPQGAGDRSGIAGGWRCIGRPADRRPAIGFRRGYGRRRPDRRGPRCRRRRRVGARRCEAGRSARCDRR